MNSSASKTGRTARALRLPHMVRLALVALVVAVSGGAILLWGIEVGFVVLAVCLLGCLGPLLAMAGMTRDQDALCCKWPQHGESPKPEVKGPPET